MELTKQNWLVELGTQECEAWLLSMDEHCLEEIELHTPNVIDHSEPHPYMDYQIQFYTRQDFNDAIALMQ